MLIDIIATGNSKGIRIPKAIIKQCGFQKTVSLEVVDHQLVIKAADLPRQTWKEQFASKENATEGFSEFQAFTNKWDDDEWQW